MINQNTARGLLLAAVALLFVIQAVTGHTIGTLQRPGPGLFPLAVSGLLLIVSLGVLARSHFIERVPLEFSFGNIALVLVALVAFGLLSEYVNMFAGIIVMTAIASFASPDFSVKRTVVIALSLCAIALALRKGIGVNLPLCKNLPFHC